MPSPEPEHHQYWFPAKQYGWGWGWPTVWQGKVVMGLWIVVLSIGGSFLAYHHWPAFAVFSVAVTAVFIGVCYAKGEPPRWR